MLEDYLKIAAIAMAYVDAHTAQEGDTVTVELGRQSVDAPIVKLPFYKLNKGMKQNPAQKTNPATEETSSTP